MGFDRDQATAFVEDVDRDRSPHFAGRSREIGRFEARLRTFRGIVEQGGVPSSLMLVYQGAPGCGKTSLAAHLAGLHPELLFVGVEKRHLASADGLTERIREAATKGDVLSNVGRGVAQAVGGLLRAGKTGGQVGDFIGDKAAARAAMVVVHLDEAQTVAGAQEEALQSLQMASLPVPVLPMFTGLSHASTRIRAIPGMSRLADDAVVDMGGMSGDECAESCRIMLDRLDVPESPRREEVCHSIAALSRGWPQHLNRAQVALCRELIRHDAALDSVDMREVGRRSDASRFAYYASRFREGVLAEAPELAAAVAVALRTEHPANRRGLARICRTEAARLALDKDPDFNVRLHDYVDNLIERGVLSQNAQGFYEMAIPSMSEWLVDRYLPGSRKR